MSPERQKKKRRNFHYKVEPLSVGTLLTSHCVSLFTLQCESGRFQGHVAISHALIWVDRDCNETEKRVQLSVSTYGECKQWRAAVCGLREPLNQRLHTSDPKLRRDPSMQNAEGLTVMLWWWRRKGRDRLCPSPPLLSHTYTWTHASTHDLARSSTACVDPAQLIVAMVTWGFLAFA